MILSISSILGQYIHKRETSRFITKKNLKSDQNQGQRIPKHSSEKKIHNLLLVLKAVVEIKIYL